ncbi:MAG TPA: L,D-transpeptidase [Acidimicrobiales bacterium]|nr:L,D-transpeptidase [Acidimicrobiales bacterium]
MRVARAVGPVLVAACLGTLGGVLATTGRDAPVVAGRVGPTVATAPALVEGAWPISGLPQGPSRPLAFPVADAAGPFVEVFDSPDAAEPEVLANPTWEGLPVVFRVLEDRLDGWLRIQVSSRPNGRTGWVRAEAVTRREVPNWIRVELAARRLTVLHGDTPLLSTTVAVGRDDTPTPLGTYFVDGVRPLEPPDPAYGAGQLSVSAFSPTLESFGGGVGQIALHGTFATGLLGEPTSNGCVRMDNGAVIQVMWLAPTGTPVEIIP